MPELPQVYFTKVPDGLLEHIRSSRPSCKLAVLAHVLRMTYGYQKVSAKIPNSEFREVTKYKTRAIQKALRYWAEQGVIQSYYNHVSREEAVDMLNNQGYFAFSAGPRILMPIEGSGWKRIPLAEPAAAMRKPIANTPRKNQTKIHLIKGHPWFDAWSEVFPETDCPPVLLHDSNRIAQEPTIKYGYSAVKAAAAKFLNNPRINSKTLSTFLHPQFSATLLKAPAVKEDRLAFAKGQLKQAQDGLAEAQKFHRKDQVEHFQKSVASWTAQIRKLSTDPPQ